MILLNLSSLCLSLEGCIYIHEYTSSININMFIIYTWYCIMGMSHCSGFGKPFQILHQNCCLVLLWTFCSVYACVILDGVCFFCHVISFLGIWFIVRSCHTYCKQNCLILLWATRCRHTGTQRRNAGTQRRSAGTQSWHTTPSRRHTTLSHRHTTPSRGHTTSANNAGTQRMEGDQEPLKS